MDHLDLERKEIKVENGFLAQVESMESSLLLGFW